MWISWHTNKLGQVLTLHTSSITIIKCLHQQSSLRQDCLAYIQLLSCIWDPQMYHIAFTTSHNWLAKEIIFKSTEMQWNQSLILNSEALFWQRQAAVGQWNSDIGEISYTLQFKHLILATVEFVKDYLSKVYQPWHVCSSASVCASFCVSAFRCKLCKQHVNVDARKPSCHLFNCALQLMLVLTLR